MEIDNFSQSPFDLLLSVLKYLDSYAELFLLPHYINILSYIQDKYTRQNPSDKSKSYYTNLRM